VEVGKHPGRRGSLVALEDSNLQPKDYEDNHRAVRQSEMDCNSLKLSQESATGQCEDYGHSTLASAKVAHLPQFY